jgi:predicted RNase H-like HicB family nuclease
MERHFTYTIELHPADAALGEKGYWVSVPALPGCFSQGDTYEEALEKAREAIECRLEALAKDGEPIPVESKPLSISSIVVALPQTA